MIYMKKLCAVICVICLSFVFANTVFAQYNANAYFLIDTNLKTAGYQGMGPVMGIAGSARVGFCLYAKQWENSKGFTVTFEWDGTKAEFRAGNSMTSMTDDEMTINGETLTPPKEENILAGALISSGVKDEAGYYTISYAKQGGDASKAPEGLIYFAVFRTASGFQKTDALTIKASVTVADEAGNTRFLGTRYFNVNQSVDVKPATWKEVKEQFKDF
jgi:hypothetical protein